MKIPDCNRCRITLTRAEETRSRDKKRKRLLLRIGNHAQYHITRAEALSIQKQLKRFKLYQ